VVHELHDVVLQLSGELDLGGVDTLDECVASALAEQPRRLVLELSSLEFADCAAIRCFVRARRSAEAARVELILDTLVPAVRRTLELTGALDAFHVR
jgi:anti-sigma B factor antagonist